jgi:hypothetical protein
MCTLSAAVAVRFNDVATCMYLFAFFGSQLDLLLTAVPARSSSTCIAQRNEVLAALALAMHEIAIRPRNQLDVGVTLWHKQYRTCACAMSCLLCTS